MRDAGKQDRAIALHLLQARDHRVESTIDRRDFRCARLGQRGRRFAAADAIAGELLTAIVADLKPPAAAELLVLINGLGGTPLGELYLLFNSTRLWLQQRDLKIARVKVDSLTTSLEMAGASITLCVMNDEMLRHWDSAVYTPSLRWGM